MTIFWIQCWKNLLQGRFPCCQCCCYWAQQCGWTGGEKIKNKKKNNLAFFTTKDPEQMDTCFLWTDELMDVLNNWLARRLWRGRTCFGLLLCKITVQFFSHALYVLSRGMGCGCVCVCVSFCLFTGQHKDTEQEWSLCLFVRMCGCHRDWETEWEGAYGCMWKGENTKYLFVSTYRDFKE